MHPPAGNAIANRYLSEPQHQNETYLQLVRAKRIDGILLSGRVMMTKL